MIRTVKKLKAWTKKRARKRKRDLLVPDPEGSFTPSCSCACSCSHHSPAFPVQPTAPPLPPWLNYQHHGGAILDQTPAAGAGFDFCAPATETSVGWVPVIRAGGASQSVPLLPAPGANFPSYQQYLVVDPVYGVPIDRLPPDGRASEPAACSDGVEAWWRKCLFCCFGKW